MTELGCKDATLQAFAFCASGLNRIEKFLCPYQQAGPKLVDQGLTPRPKDSRKIWRTSSPSLRWDTSKRAVLRGELIGVGAKLSQQAHRNIAKRQITMVPAGTGCALAARVGRTRRFRPKALQTVETEI